MFNCSFCYIFTDTLAKRGNKKTPKKTPQKKTPQKITKTEAATAGPSAASTSDTLVKKNTPLGE